MRKRGQSSLESFTMSASKKKIELLPLMLIIVGVWVVFALCSWFYFENWQLGGVFGDTFGAINALFSGLALAGIIYTVWLQKDELALQRKELADTRKEFEQQNETLRKQRFENTFFQLIGIHHSVTREILKHSGSEFLRGGEAIQFLLSEFSGMYYIEKQGVSLPEITKENYSEYRKLTYNVFRKFYSKNEHYLSHYFNNLISLMRLAKESDLIKDTERSFYYSIIISQLSSTEVTLLFYRVFTGWPQDGELFDTLALGAKLDPSKLVDANHSYLFDPQWVVEMAIEVREAKNR